MPHLSLEYSANLEIKKDFRELFSLLHKVLAEEAGILESHCKSRAVMRQDYFIADGKAQHAFVHLEVAILQGRTNSIKKKLGDSLLQALKQHFGTPPGLQISIEIRDMKKDQYHKYPALNKGGV